MNNSVMELANDTLVDKYSDILNRQSRCISLLLWEAQLRARELKELVDKLNAKAKKKYQVTCFEHLFLSEEHLFKFTEEAKYYYPDVTGFMKGNCSSAESFSEICEELFTCDYKGEQKKQTMRCVMCTEEELKLFSKWMANHDKVFDHIHRAIDTGKLFSNDRPQDVMAVMGGWNAQPIVCYREGEYREFSSITDAVKLTGYNRKKLTKAVKEQADYLGWKWVTKEQYETLNKTA